MKKTFICRGKELNKGQVELYRNFNKEAEVGNKIYYSLVLGGKVNLTLRADNIYYNADGTGTISITLGDTFPNRYWDVQERKEVIITPQDHEATMTSIEKLLLANGFEETKPRQQTTVTF